MRLRTHQRLLSFLFSLLACLFILSSTSTAQQQAFTTEDALNVQNISVVDLTDDGIYAAALVSSRKNRLGVNHERFGDPTYIAPRTYKMVVINTETGEQVPVYNEDVQVRQLTWSSDGNNLAFFKLNEDGNGFNLHIYERERDRTRMIRLKTDKAISSNSLLEWRPDGSGLLIELRDEGWADKAKAMYREIEEGPILVQNSMNDFLAWDRVWNISDREILAQADLDSREVTEWTEETNLNNINQAESGNFITYMEEYPQKTDYEREGGSVFALLKLDLQEESRPDTLRPRSGDRLNIRWNEAGDTFAYSDEGSIFIQSVDEDEPVDITGDFLEKVEDRDTTEVSYSLERWHPQGTHLLVESDEGYHLVDTAGEDMELVYEYPEERDEAPRRDIEFWSPDGQYLYMTYSARDRWQRGLTRYDLEDRSMETLKVDDRLYSSWDFAENGERIIYESSDGDLPNELYAASPKLDNPQRLTNLNPWLDNRKLTRSELIQYLDVDGDTLYGILYYPVDYEVGNTYPLVAQIYEDFFNNGFNTAMNLFANEGYFGFRPSVNFETGYPGEAWLKGVTTGINKLIEGGLVDGSKLGVQGTSYGGYAANLLITQTDRFAAAVNISGKVNMISFLGDSPKITTRNYDAAEVGQDRIGQTFWEAPDKYIAHSAVFYADRIETPLLMLSGEGDWNVPATNQREMYYAMRRLGKEVKWVHYMRAGHGAGRAGMVEDYHHHWETVLDWYKEKF